jgi:CYTH domain-containing protein
MPQEIERKFVLFEFPQEMEVHGDRIEQGYITLPNATVSMRLRTKGSKTILTFKGPGTSVRNEHDIDISTNPWLGSALWNSVNPDRIIKTRYTIPDGDGNLEVDVYHGEHASLSGKVTMEREFKSTDEMAEWTPPHFIFEYILREVTGDGRYQNSSLALSGWPDS